MNLFYAICYTCIALALCSFAFRMGLRRLLKRVEGRKSRVEWCWLVLGLVVAALWAGKVEGATIRATSCATNDVMTAYNAAASGDTILLPPGTAVWANTQPFTKKSITFMGSGVDATIIQTTVQTGGGEPDLGSTFWVIGTTIRVSNFTITNIVPGGLNGGGYGVGGQAGAFRIDHMRFGGLNTSVYIYGYGLIDHCTNLNDTLVVQCAGDGIGATPWSTRYPIAFDDILHNVVVEDCYGDWNSANPHLGRGNVVIAGGQGCSYILRRNYFTCSAGTWSPAGDFHGDAHDGTHGTLSAQVYVNTFAMSGIGFMDKFWDCRGGRFLIYSNTVTGADSSVRGISLREEWPTDLPLDPEPHDLINHSYTWNNTTNGVQMNVYIDEDPGGLLHLGVQYNTNAPTPLVASVYPHPWNTNFTSAAPSAPSNFRILSAANGSVTLGWDASADPTVNDYHVYWGDLSGTYTNNVDAGNTTSTTVNSLNLTTANIYFAGTDTNTNGVESVKSVEAVYTPPPIVNNFQSGSGNIAFQTLDVSQW